MPWLLQTQKTQQTQQQTHLTSATALQVPMPFLTTILVPIVGNAAEHASAIVFAYKNRIEISLGVAVGSSTQVSWVQCGLLACCDHGMCPM